MTALSYVNGSASQSGGSGSAEVSGWPQLRTEALYGLAGEVVRAATAESEADPAAVLMTFLTAAGIFAGRRLSIKVSDDYHHPRLFSVLVGQSARGRKGTSEGPIRRIFEIAEDVVDRPFAWKPGPMSSGEGLIFNIRDGDGGEDAGIPDKRLLIVESEFAAPLRAMRRDGNTLSTTLRAAWDGRDLEPLTKTNPIKASEPHVGIVGHITEVELKKQLGHSEIFNGFANRFLWLCVRRDRLLPLARGMSVKDTERLGGMLARQFLAAQDIKYMEFSPAARRAYEDAYEALTADHGGLYGVITSRAEVQVIRLAMIYACLDNSETIDLPHLAAAFAVWEYCDASARRLFGDIVSNPLESRLLEILAGGAQSQTDLHKHLGNHTTSADLRAALMNLEGQGRIESVSVSTSGRARTVWRVREGFRPANEAKQAN